MTFLFITGTGPEFLILSFITMRKRHYVPNLLLEGIATTLRLAFWATIVAATIGLVMGYMRTSKNLAMRMISRCYVELVLNIPPVVFIFIFYFFLSGQLMPLIGIDDIDRNGAFVSSSLFLHTVW